MNLLKIIFLSFLASASMTNPPTSTEKQFLGFVNQLSNPGFESGSVGWTAATTAPVITTTTGEYSAGSRALKWVPVGSDTLTGPTWTIKTNAAGNGVAFMRARTSGTVFTMEVYDGSSVVTSVTVPSVDVFVPLALNFVAASAGTYKIRVSTTGSGTIYVDNTGIGYAEGYNIGQVSQAIFIGSAYFATTGSCTFTRTNTALGALADTDCPGPTVELNPGPGTIQTTDANAPIVTVNNLPAGYYEVQFTGGSVIGTSAQLAALAINDGTTTSGQTTAPNLTTATSNFKVTGYFTYTATGNRSFELYASSAANAFNIDLTASNQRLYFSIKRYPVSSEQAYNPVTLNSSWSGYHDATCSWARTNTAYGDPATDASCGLTERTNSNFGTVTGANNLPSITFTPARVGRYYVCALVSVAGATTAADLAVRLWDGTTTIAERDSDAAVGTDEMTLPLCGIYNNTSLTAKTLSLQTKASTGAITITALTAASAIEWSIFQIDQSLPAPLLTGSIVTPANGATKLVSASLAYSAGTPTVSRQDGTWISSLTDNGTGDVSVNITAGTFSATPSCSCTATSSGAGGCDVDSTTTPSSTVMRFQAFTTSTGTAGDIDMQVFCMGSP